MNNDSSVRAHHAARIIANYVAVGEHKHALEALMASELFEYYRAYNWWASKPISDDHERYLLVGLAVLWPAGKLDNFSHTPVFRLFRHHSTKERNLIIQLLGNMYGFDIDE